MDAFKEVNYYLDSLSNFHFAPRPGATSKAEAVIIEERVPIPNWKNGGGQEKAVSRDNF